MEQTRQKCVDLPVAQIAQLLGHYGLSLSCAEPLYLGMDNINIKVTTQGRGDYVLKVCSAPEAIVQQQLTIMGECGSPDQQPLTTRSGGNTFRFEGRVGYLLPFIAGDDFLGRELSLAQIRQVAAYHRAFAQRVATIGARPEPNIWDLADFYTHLDRYTAHLPTAVELPEVDFAGLPKVPVHNDFTRSNLLELASGGLHLLDFGDVAYGFEVVDLAVALAHFCFEETPNARVLEHAKQFLRLPGEAGGPTERDARRLYRLVRLRFIQAIALTRYEASLFGTHPRGDYWLDFGYAGLAQLHAISESRFIEAVCA